MRPTHILGWLSTFSLLSTISLADEASSTAVEIQLSECRIKLIDQVTLASDRTGIIRFVEPKEGGRVQAKQKIAALQDDLVQSELAAAEHKATNDIEVRASQKARELADAELDKALQANRDVKNTVPAIELHRLKLAAEKAVLEIELAEHELVFNRLQRDFKRTELGTFAIIAPFSGVVTKVYKQRGEAVRQGDPIVELTNTDRVRIEGWVDPEYAWQISIGNPVAVRLNLPDVDSPVGRRVFAGRITFVDVSVHPVTRQTKIFAEVVNQDNLLLAGYTADMNVRLNADRRNPPPHIGSTKVPPESKEDSGTRFQRMLKTPVDDKTRSVPKKK